MIAATFIPFILALLTLAAWLGEVVTLNFIVVPNLNKMERDQKAAFLARFFPKFFRQATVLALSTLALGIVGLLLSDASFGATFTVAAVLLLVLTTFHLVVESRLRPIARRFETEVDDKKLGFVVRFLNIVPRLGFVVITSIFLLYSTSLFAYN